MSNPQVRRRRDTGLAMRGHVAMSGIFGYELDMSAMDEGQRVQVAEQISRVKRIRHIVQYGAYTRLLSPFEGNLCAWQFAYQDEVLLFAFQILQTPSTLPGRICLHGINDGVYEDQETGRRLSGSDLTRHGVEADFRTGGGNFQSRVFHWKRTE